MGKNLIFKNPYLEKENEILIYGTGRRHLEPDGRWWDIYFDPIYESGLSDFVHLEPPREASHYSHIQTNSYRYIDLIRYGPHIPLKLGVKKPTIPDNVKKKLIELEGDIHDKFGIKINIYTEVYEKLHLRETKRWFLNKLLKRVKPKVIVIVCSYGKETLIEVAKSLKIPVIELQHGVITDSHLGYSYNHANKTMFPDYLFIWGDFWKDSAKIPLPDHRIISTGYPYHDHKKGELSSVNSARQIVFISQDTIGEKLSEFAVALDRYLNFNYDIIYKLHPNEYADWEARYPELKEADLEVIGSDGAGLYKLFAESSIQIGVYSTALFEGIDFGLDTFIYNISGWKQIKQLVDKTPAQTISSPEEVVSLIKQTPKEPEDNIQIFKENGVRNTIKEINKIKNSGTTFDTLSK
jgi:rRNA-processing protein FCF1